MDLIISTLCPRGLKKSQPILDLACGMGRHVELFRRRGFWVQGIDLSEELIQEGRRYWPQLPIKVGDMRSFVGGYQAILSLFTSFGYFEKESEDLRVLANVFQALRPGGHLWLDFLNAPRVRQNLASTEEVLAGRRESFFIQKSLERGRAVKTISHRLGGRVSVYRESVRLYSRNELVELFVRSGFEMEKFFGNYRGAPWSETSERLILVGRKKT